MHVFEQCLHMGRPEGYVLPFLHAGYSLRPLLRQAIMQAVETAYAQKLLKALEDQEHSLSPDSRRQTAPSTLDMAEPLTERERQILRLLAAGLNSTQIAEELVISVNTARSYIKNLHSKLDAHSREEAIEKGIQLGLL